MVKTRNIPDRITKTRMHSELHWDLWAMIGRGHTRVFGEDLPLDSPRPSPPIIPASPSPLFLSSPPPWHQVLSSSLDSALPLICTLKLLSGWLLSWTLLYAFSPGVGNVEKTHMANEWRELGQVG